MSRPLPERYRKARNVHDGYEIRLVNDDGSKPWVRVESAFHISAPIAVSHFTLADGEGRVAADPNDEIMSRRPAGGAS